MNTATKQPFALDETHKNWIRDNWPDLASHFDLFHLEYIRMEKQANARFEVLEEGLPTGRMRSPEHVYPITLADVAPALCPCCGRLEQVKTDALDLDAEIQQQMPTEPVVTPVMLLTVFALAVVIAVVQWVAS